VVVDQDGLVFEPVTPAGLADPLMHSFPDGVSEGGLFQLGSVFLASVAADGVHGDLESMGFWMVVHERIKLQQVLVQSREQMGS